MSLPYENATSGEKSLKDLQKILQTFGVQAFGQMMDYEKGELCVQFKYRNQMIEVRASMKGYAETWRRHHPYSHRMRKTKQEWTDQSDKVASFAIYSILRDWLKGQITAVEVGLMSFEVAFVAHLLLPNGQRLIDVIVEKRLVPQLEYVDAD